ncbi:hypothetical protein C2845_PM14G02250 [Panicum miliaceum]|uniref:Uncharacterized protein n=1 Tax=Panicum miliaceum TaxID=4540 RepID=A0A3L6PTZ8_PANMI|nr:hypothetical protein C2845_PM14G02250 [Panicum miliaceum]
MNGAPAVNESTHSPSRSGCNFVYSAVSRPPFTGAPGELNGDGPGQLLCRLQKVPQCKCLLNERCS